nr:AAA family ATPase [Acidimicrobiales bacterium]
MTGLQPGAATLTVLFTDLVDSTAMRSRLGDDQADDVRREHDELIRQHVAGQRGTIVKGLGDGVLAVFPAPSEGLAAAVGIQQEIARRNRQARVPIALRMGLSVGEVRVDADDVFGTPVVEASRLCSAAQADQILSAAIVCRLAGSRSGASHRSVGDLELKGLPEPLSTVEVLWWETSAAPSIPLPDMSPAGVPYPFMGRSVERYAIAHAWLQARTAAAPVVFVSGPAGMGKTRFVAEFARTAQNEGGIVLYGHCEDGSGITFQPFVEAVRHYQANVPPGQIAQQLGRGAADLGRLVPELADVLPASAPAAVSADPDAEATRVFDAVPAWLEAAALDEPILLVLDDLHWASASTLDLLRRVLRSDAPMRVLVVGTFDTDAVGDEHPLRGLIDELRAEGRPVEHIELAAVGDDTVAGIVEHVLGAPLGEQGAALVTAIGDAAGGNPFVAGEMARTLVVQGRLREEGGQLVAPDPADLGVPAAVPELVDRRLALLQPATVELLRRASVVGAEFEVALIRQLTELDEAATQAALDEAVAAGFVTELPSTLVTYAFAHGLLRQALYDLLDATQRGEAHRDVAAAIERQAGAGSRDDRYVAQLAAHLVRSGVPDDKAVEYTRRAGDRARDQLAVDDAAVWYRTSLELRGQLGMADDAAALDLLLSLGDAERRTGQLAARATLLRAADVARASDDTAGLARAALLCSRPVDTLIARRDPERLAVLRDALAAIGTDDSPTRALLLADLAAELTWTPGPEDRFALAAEAVAVARRSDDPTVVSQVLQRRLGTIQAPGNDADVRALADEVLSLADELGDPALRYRAARAHAGLAAAAGDLEAHDRWFTTAEESAGQLHRPEFAWPLGFGRAARAHLSGDLVLAEELADETLRIGERDGGDARLLYLALMAGIRRHQGRSGDVVVALGDVSLEGVDDAFLAARARCEAGDLDAAGAVYRTAAGEGFAVGNNLLTVAALENLALLCVAAGDVEGAAALLEKLEPHADRFGLVVGFQHVGAHYLGLLSACVGRTDDANRWFARALAAHERVGAPLLAAETRLEWASACFEVGDVERARELIGQGLAAGAKADATGVEERARALLTLAFPAEEPAVEEPAVEEPVADEEPSGEAMADEISIVEASVEEASAEEPPVEEPPVEEPAVEVEEVVA